MNLLLDTNVLIDYLGRKEPFFGDAQKLVAAGFFKDVTLWTPAASYTDSFYVLNHYISSQRIQDAILETLKTIAPVSLQRDELVQAARLKWADFEDCLVAMAALKCKADYIVSRDARGFERSMVPVLSPAECLALLKAERNCEYGVVKL